MQEKNLLIGAGILGAIVLLTKGKIGGYIGQASGRAVSGVASGVVQGAVKGIFKDPYDWAVRQDRIPVMDELARTVVKIKQLGNNDRWFS